MKGLFSYEKTSKLFTGLAFMVRQFTILCKQNMLLFRRGVWIKCQPEPRSDRSLHKSNVRVQAGVMITFGGSTRERGEIFTVCRVILQCLGQGGCERCSGGMGVAWGWWIYCHLRKVTWDQDLLWQCHWSAQKNIPSYLREQNPLLSEQEYYQKVILPF